MNCQAKLVLYNRRLQHDEIDAREDKRIKKKKNSNKNKKNWNFSELNWNKNTKWKYKCWMINLQEKVRSLNYKKGSLGYTSSQ